MRGVSISRSTAESALYTRAWYQDQHAGALASAQVVVPLVLELLSTRSVCDVGCGVGAWLSVFRQNGIFDIVGIDGAHVTSDMLLVPQSQFLSHDLATPIALDRVFDLAISLEVAEHLPVSCAGPFVENLTRLSRLVLFSAAIPGQGGTGHVNEQWQDYWAEQFARHGYRPIDAFRPIIWHDDRVEWWYRQNMLLFAHESAMRGQPRLISLAAQTGMLSVVHPEKFLRSLPDEPYFTGALRQMPGLFWKAMKKRLR